MIAIVDWNALLTVIWSSAVAGVGVTAAYGLVILGSVRVLELGRAGRTAEAAIYALIGAIGLMAVLGAIVFGIVVLIDN